jgi:hypothetical protein
MTINRRMTGGMLCSLGLGALLAAQAANLDLKTGLWEVTAVSSSAGMPQIDTSKMTPEQAARVEAAMRGRSAGQPQTHVTKTCMTKEKLANAAFASNDDANCKPKITANTRTSMDATVVCTGEQPSTSTFHFEASSPTAFTGTTKMNMSGGRANGMKVDVALSGKYIGPDCGTVK